MTNHDDRLPTGPDDSNEPIDPVELDELAELADPADLDELADDELVDGHTVDELIDYLDADRTPRDPSIENSAACRLYLAALTRLRTRSWDGLARAAHEDPNRDDTWIAGLLTSIKQEVRAGRDIPIDDPDAAIRLTLTEAAVQGVIRGASDALDGVILGRCTLVGDVTIADTPITAEITAAARFGQNLDDVADRLRSAVLAAIERHTELVIAAINVTIDDIYPRRGQE